MIRASILTYFTLNSPQTGKMEKREKSTLFAEKKVILREEKEKEERFVFTNE